MRWRWPWSRRREQIRETAAAREQLSSLLVQAQNLADQISVSTGGKRG